MTVRRDGGFTLVELLIAMALAGMLIAVMSAAFIVSVRSTSDNNVRLAVSNDAGITSTWFGKDVLSAETLSTTAASCGGTGELVVSASWTDAGAAFAVDYRYSTAADGTGVLRRVSCQPAAEPHSIASELVEKPQLLQEATAGGQVVVTMVLTGADGTFDLVGTLRTS